MSNFPLKTFIGLTACLALAVNFNAHASADNAPKLVSRFMFDSTNSSIVRNEIDNAPDGTLMGNADYDLTTVGGNGVVAGQSELVLDNDSSTTADYMTASVSLPQAFSFSLFARSNTPTWNASGWLASAFGPGGFTISPNQGQTSWNLYMYGNDGGPILAGACDLSPDITEWHQYGFTYDGQTAALYFDGKECGHKTVARGDTSNPLLFTIGKGQGASGDTQYGSGDVADVRLYEGALNSDAMHKMVAGNASNLAQLIAAFGQFVHEAISALFP